MATRIIPPPAPACRRQATKPRGVENDYHTSSVRSFATAATGVRPMSRREAQVVG
jgi:hypothetical protein